MADPRLDESQLDELRLDELRLDDGTLKAAAMCLLEAATMLRSERALPMLAPETYTGVGTIIGAYMRAADIAGEAVSDAWGAQAATVAGLMSATAELEVALVSALGPGFVDWRVEP